MSIVEKALMKAEWGTEIDGRLDALEAAAAGSAQFVRVAPTFVGISSGTYFNGGSRTPTVPAGVAAGDTLIVLASYRGGAPSFTSENQPIMEGGAQTWVGIHQPSTAQYVMHTVYNGNPSLGTLPDPGWSNTLNWVVLAFRGVSSIGVLHHGVRGFNGGLMIPDGTMVVANQTFFDTAGSFTPPAGWSQSSQPGYGGQFVAWRPYTQGSTGNLILTATTGNPSTLDHISILSLSGVLTPFAPVDVEVLKRAVEVPLTSGTLANNATVNLDLETIGRKSTLWAVTAHNAAGLWWIRAYSTSVQRIGDAGRSYTTDPASLNACLFELLLDATVTVPYVLDARVSNRDTPRAPKIYLAITNLSGASTTLNLTLEAMIEEA